jgi:hypothetical protein
MAYLHSSKIRAKLVHLKNKKIVCFLKTYPLHHSVNTALIKVSNVDTLTAIPASPSIMWRIITLV